MREQMVLDEKIVGVELSSQKKTFKWPVQEEQAKKNNNNNKKNAKDDDDDESTDDFSALQKTLHVHSAVLGAGAKADQRNLVHLTIKDTDPEKTILDQPIFSLSLNKNDSISAFNLRILLTETTEVTFKLVEGDGPVHLITSKIIEPPFDMANYASDDDDDQFDEMSDSSDDDMQDEVNQKAQPISANKTSKKSKKNPGESAANNTNNSNASESQQPKKKRKKDE